MTEVNRSAAERRRELLHRLMAEQGLAVGQPAIPRHAEHDGSLSYIQQQLWLFDRINPGTAAYNVPAVVRLRGRLDVAALDAALDSVRSRHAVLRARFDMIDDRPVQRFAPHMPQPMPYNDMSGRPDDVDEAVRAEIRAPFDLSAGSLLRALLIRTGPNDHRLVLTMHHAVGDASSWEVLLTEISAGYRAQPLPPLPVQYGDYARWQRDLVVSGGVAASMSYWRARFAVAPPPLDLPTDRSRPARPRHRGDVVRFDLTPDTVARLAEFARSARTTPFVVALAAFQALLHRYSGQTDITVGTPVSSRDHPQLQPLVGVFVNTVLLRVTIDPRASFRQMVVVASGEASAALAHHVVPYDYLVEQLRPARSPRSEPFFQTMFSMRPEPSAWTLGDIEAELQPAHTATSKRDLTMLLLESSAGVRGEIEYDTDLFDAATVARMAGHFVTLLDNYLAEPDRASGEVTMVSDTELAALAAPNATTLAVPDQRIEQAFEDQARRTPDAIAVRDDHQTLTFRELDGQADALAERLAKTGVGSGTYVGLRLERSVDMVIGVLAILKCGAAYVPIDPHDPTGRSSSVLADAGAVVVVSSPGSDDLPGITTVRVEDHHQPVGSRPGPAGRTGDAAYVLYTSGSTGLPKGVVVEHRQLLSYVHAALERFAVDGPLRYLMLQPLTVDSSVTMLFPPLLTGGELHLVGRARALDAGALADYTQRYAIDCLKIAPSHLRALQASPRFAELLPRRLLVVGGEPSDWRWLVGVQRSAPYCKVFNHYGPTETTVGVLTFLVSGLEDADFTVTPIGIPLPGTRAWVLDDDGRVLPPGVPGELYVGGANVARGYLNRPGPTAAAFVPDPFGAVGARLYRTGDIARLRADGSFEFHGRRDAQVKIHGFRIELGEIDTVLAGHPDVAHAVTVVREYPAGERRIVSYAVAGRSGLDVDQLDRYLRDRLPGHMVPSSVVLLAELPRTPHGKIDQAALPAPRPSGGPARPPRTDLEHRIGAVWQRLLGVEQIDVDQNFFELGGSSLLIIRLHQELQKELGREFHLVELFSATTVRDQACQLGDGPALGLDRGRVRGRKQAEIVKRRTGSRRPGSGKHD